MAWSKSKPSSGPAWKPPLTVAVPNVTGAPPGPTNQAPRIKPKETRNYGKAPPADRVGGI